MTFPSGGEEKSICFAEMKLLISNISEEEKWNYSNSLLQLLPMLFILHSSTDQADSS